MIKIFAADILTSLFGATTECRATSDHLFYMCQNLFKNEAEHNKDLCDSMRCK